MKPTYWFYKNVKSSWLFFAASIEEGRVKTVHESLLFVKGREPIHMNDKHQWNKVDKPYLSVLIPEEFLQ